MQPLHSPSPCLAKMPGYGMKPVKGGGLSGGARRVKNPEVDTEHLLDKLRTHIKGQEIPASAFDLGSYNRMKPNQAANGKSLFQIRELLVLLLSVSPGAMFSYSLLKPLSCSESALV
jgi:hypothetical protein